MDSLVRKAILAAIIGNCCSSNIAVVDFVRRYLCNYDVKLIEIKFALDTYKEKGIIKFDPSCGWYIC